MTNVDVLSRADSETAEPDADALTIGRRIRQLRTARGMTLDELAAAADVALTSIYSNFPGGKADLYAVLACRVGSEHVAAMEAAGWSTAPGAA